MTRFVTKRVYEDVSPNDGYRVLVDRLWPRGVSKERAKLDEWAKDIAPSTELRIWFGHDPAKFDEFKKRYIAELHANPEFEPTVKNWRTHAKVTLLYGARNEGSNEAVVLQQHLQKPS